MSNSFFIDDTKVGAGADCFVVAEIGHNHQGNVELCKRMILSAKEIGASAVKLQKRNNRTLFTPDFYRSVYTGKHSFGKTYGAHREALEFSIEQIVNLKEYADKIGICLFSTVFDIQSAEALAHIDFPAYKIASADLKNLPLLDFVAGLGKPVIASTGGATLDQVKKAVDRIKRQNEELALLQCTAQYPVADQFINLRVIESYKTEFPNVVIGYSGHEIDILPSVVARALGADVIERHFTLDKEAKGSDNKMSLDRAQFQELVNNLQRVKVILGDGVKRFYDDERQALRKMGKKIVASQPLSKGKTLTLADVKLMSPGDGLTPDLLDSVIGRALKSDVNQYEAIKLEFLE